MSFAAPQVKRCARVGNAERKKQTIKRNFGQAERERNYAPDAENLALEKACYSAVPANRVVR
jgi:hypothetical protein